MAVRIGTNISSLQAQRRLSQSTNELTSVYERLSSGLRINRASDDAAGLAVVSALNNGARLYTVANRNLNDAISLISVASGALSEQNSILGRLSELAEQSANGTYSASQRGNLNKEYSALLEEFGRLGNSTEFNGIKPLLSGRSGGTGSVIFQVGINGGGTSQLTFNGTDTGSSSGTFDPADFAAQDLNNDGLGGFGDEDFFVSRPHSLEELTSIFKNRLQSRTVIDSQGRTRNVLFGLISGQDPTSFEILSFVQDIGADTYSGTLDAVARIQNLGFGGPSSVNFSAQTGQVTSGAVQTIDLGIGVSATIDLSGTIFQTPSTGVSSALEFTGVETVSRAREALDIIAQRRAEISSILGNFGAIQSRAQSALSLTAVSRENYQQASGRISDADVAAESARLVQNQIKQQAAAAVLSQANQQPSLVLQLLR